MARGTQICAIFQFDLVAKNLDHQVWGPTFYVNMVWSFNLFLNFVIKAQIECQNRWSFFLLLVATKIQIQYTVRVISLILNLVIGAV